MGVTSMDKELNIVNLITSDRCFRALDSVLNKETSEYSILIRKEWKTCLTCENGQWKVSFIERGQDVSPKYFKEVNDACLYLIDSVTSKRKARKAKELFINKVGTEPTVINKNSQYLVALQKIAML